MVGQGPIPHAIDRIRERRRHVASCFRASSSFFKLAPVNSDSYGPSNFTTSVYRFSRIASPASCRARSNALAASSTATFCLSRASMSGSVGIANSYADKVYEK
jgi:hypothetical protein